MMKIATKSVVFGSTLVLAFLGASAFIPSSKEAKPLPNCWAGSTTVTTDYNNHRVQALVPCDPEADAIVECTGDWQPAGTNLWESDDCHNIGTTVDTHHITNVYNVGTPPNGRYYAAQGAGR